MPSGKCPGGEEEEGVKGAHLCSISPLIPGGEPFQKGKEVAWGHLPINMLIIEPPDRLMTFDRTVLIYGVGSDLDISDLRLLMVNQPSYYTFIRCVPRRRSCYLYNYLGMKWGCFIS